MRWAGHAVRMGEKISVYRGNLRERDRLDDPDLDGRVIVRWIFRKKDGGLILDWSVSG